MPIQIMMPTLSPTMDKGKLAKWRVKEGQHVRAGDVICEVETDKATIEVEAVDSGRVGKLLVAEGTADVKVNTPIAFLEGEATSRAGGGLSTRIGAVRPLSTATRAPATTAPPSVAPNPEIVPTARPGDVLSSGGSAPAGTVIGRARLKGDHGQAAVPSMPAPVSPTVSLGTLGGGGPSAPTAQAAQAGKTKYILPQNTETDPVAGWVVVIKGPGAGDFRPIYVGMNSVGRDSSQRISLSFGDESISREEHAFITYDEEQRSFYLQHGGKPNIIRLGAAPVLTPMELKPNDLIRIGRTTLRFIPCCGPNFSWSDEIED
jgi:pyruvate/2-oxoglutarate dehydrogenase complex dihydrolipoamide acyltransferase (E2) component